MNRTSMIALSLLSVGFLVQAPAGQRPVEDVLPGSSYAVVQFGGLEQIVAAGNRLGLVQLGKGLAERGGQAAFERTVNPAIEQAAAELRRELGRIGVSAGDLRALMRQPMALGIGRPTVIGDAVMPSIGLVVEVGSHADEIGRVLDALQGVLLQMEPGLRLEEAELEGQRVRTLSIDDAPGNLVAGRIGDFLVVTNSRGYFRDCARVIAGNVPPMAGLGAARLRLPEPAMLSAYVNTSSVLAVLDPFLPYEATEIGESLGVQGLSGLFLGASGSGAGTAEVLHVGLTGDEGGMLRAPFVGPVSLDAASYCSEDTVLFAAAKLDPAAFLAAGERMLALLPRNARTELERGLSQGLAGELRQHGMEPEQLLGLLRAFGPAVSFAVNLPRQPIPIPELLAFIEIRDPRAIEPVLNRIMTESELEWRTTSSRDREIYYSNVLVEQVRLSPCFAIDDGMLVISSHVRNLKAALAQTAEPERSLASDPEFRDLVEELGAASAFVHVRGDRVVSMTWPMLEAQLRMVVNGPGRDIGLSSDMLPDVDEVSAAVGTGTLSVHVDEQGVLLKQVSHSGLGAQLAIAGMFLDAVLAAAQGRIY